MTVTLGNLRRIVESYQIRYLPEDTEVVIQQDTDDGPQNESALRVRLEYNLSDGTAQLIFDV